MAGKRLSELGSHRGFSGSESVSLSAKAFYFLHSWQTARGEVGAIRDSVAQRGYVWFTHGPIARIFSATKDRNAANFVDSFVIATVINLFWHQRGGDNSVFDYDNGYDNRLAENENAPHREEEGIIAMSAGSHEKIVRNFLRELKPLSFSAPVTHVYNPLEYAVSPYLAYADRFGSGEKEAVFIGMNPGPWGMAQTGIPFGEVDAVSGWMGIRERVSRPRKEHPKRPVDGFSCKRSEVSGRRLWGWAKKRFGTPERFFARFFVANYCPLMFMESSGKNRTPDKLPVAEKKPLLAACDGALRDLISLLSPRFAVGIGNFAEQRLQTVLADLPVTIGKITHPSPANPRANKDWTGCIEAELMDLGVRI